MNQSGLNRMTPDDFLHQAQNEQRGTIIYHQQMCFVKKSVFELFLHKKF